jgi:hypothetical protein
MSLSVLKSLPEPTTRVVHDALALIKAIGDTLTFVNHPHAPDLMPGTLEVFGNLFIDKANEVAQSLGFELD